jgi:hypothetical protein
MNKALATICLVASTMALSACGETTHSSSSYANGTTAHYEKGVEAPVAPADQTFQKSQLK